VENSVWRMSFNIAAGCDLEVELGRLMDEIDSYGLEALEDADPNWFLKGKTIYHPACDTFILISYRKCYPGLEC
jgi:hypothetical protein